MRKINLILFLFFIFSYQKIWAFNHYYHNNKDYPSIEIKSDKKLSIGFKSQIYNELEKASSLSFIKENINNINIHIIIEKHKKKISFSNALPKNCNITLNYDDSLNGSLLDDFKDDILFTYLHEIGHCSLGKDIFINGLDWEGISENEKNTYNEKIQLQTNFTTIGVQCQIDCNSSNLFKTPPPLVVYHEIYADMIAFYLLSTYDCSKGSNILLQIENIRMNNYWKNIDFESHQSFRASNYLEKRNLCHDRLSLTDVKKMTQLGFIDYLNDLKIKIN